MLDTGLGSNWKTRPYRRGTYHREGLTGFWVPEIASALGWTRDTIHGVFISCGWVQMGKCLPHMHKALGVISSPAYAKLMAQVYDPRS